MPSTLSLQRVYGKVIFDMDGTLVDSHAVVERAWRSWARRHGLAADAVLAVSHGRRTHETVREFAPEGMDVDREARKLEAVETADLEDIRAIPGAVELLRWLPKSDWAVVTSATRQLASRRIVAAGLPLPDILITADDVSTGKPHPEGYLSAVEQLRASADECLVFEDAQAGILAAKAAGCDVVAITGGRPQHFRADCPAVADFRAVSFALKTTTQRWAGQPR